MLLVWYVPIRRMRAITEKNNVDEGKQFQGAATISAEGMASWAGPFLVASLGGGISVGTYNAVPEPSGAVLVTGAFVSGLCRRY